VTCRSCLFLVSICISFLSHCHSSHLYLVSSQPH
jgi:hypothetical protein